MSLKNHLLRQIAVDGPLSVASYMQTCLLHPELGYYTTRDPIGRGGDFITAPEVSQMFGELIGLCLAQAWVDQGGGPCILAELGPGRGTLMADILRATRTVPNFAPAVHLVELSETLRDIQAITLTGVDITWHRDVTTLPEAPLYFVANEFFDALPIRQFLRQGDGWVERLIGAKDGQLQFGLGAPMPVDTLAHRLNDTEQGDMVEVCASAAPMISELSNRIARHGGAGLIVDYGDWGAVGDTFQAVKDHAPCDPLHAPGSADLTAHVDFEALAAHSACTVTSMIIQGAFLHQLGIGPRAQALAERLDDEGDTEGLTQHLAAYRRLTDPSEMGNLFKAIALHPEGAPPPPGFAQ